jgi:signal transduction histidine kinase
VKRLKLFIIIFFISLSIPLGYFILRTHQSLDQEEVAELRYFADTLFYEMEKEMAEFIRKEEGRAIDDYTDGSKVSSELSNIPTENYILGYFQNNPDGSFQTPIRLKDPLKAGDIEQARVNEIIDELEADNRQFNTKRTETSRQDIAAAEIAVAEPDTVISVKKPEKIIPEKETPSAFAGKYLDLSRSKKQKAYLGQEEKRVEEITARQAQNLAKMGKKMPEMNYAASPAPALEAFDETSGTAFSEADTETAPVEAMEKLEAQQTVVAESRKGEIQEGEIQAADAKEDSKRWRVFADTDSVEGVSKDTTADMMSLDEYDKNFDSATFQIEIDPMQSVFVSENKVVLFRRIVIDNHVYRQGMVILVKEFTNHLLNAYFKNQPMAKFTRLNFSIFDQGKEKIIMEAGATAQFPKFTLSRTFPRPFSFLTARLDCERIPRSEGRKTLNIMLTVMAVVVLLGFFAIYQSARSIIGMSERRSQFVSSVTHELKTPLTNIRMYIEMLEQGIAPNPEREQEYFKILGSESTRLSRLINNVLEFSKLEKKNRQLDLSGGTFEDVIEEVSGIMHEKLRLEGFTLNTEKVPENVRPFIYDREVMVQVLINLIENSIKFGKNEPVKQITLSLAEDNNQMTISLSDTGPGIPKKALKKVFDDFYRVDNELTRTTGGTGIGLALVGKFVKAMGGRVAAKNNDGPGCTISIFLPLKS